MPNVGGAVSAFDAGMPGWRWRELCRRAGCVALLVLSLACREAASDAAAAGKTPIVLAEAVAQLPPATLTLPAHRTSVKFAVIGDSGRGTPPQHEVAAQMTRFHAAFPFPFVIMLGDNIYEGPASPDDYRRKFEEPYKALLEAGVKFYAVLGNHDDPRQVDYALFHMDGERYYTFAPPEDLVTKIATQVEFFAIDSTNFDRGQATWLDERLRSSNADWKICFLHHPLYTSGRYRTSARLHRWMLESVFVQHGVDVVFSGHEHIYQRSQLQYGIQYFVSGGAGSLRIGDGVRNQEIAMSYDRDYHFMLVEIHGDDLYFQTISRNGTTIDAGTLHQDAEDAKPAARTP
jgi:predicted phosphodiesterase